MPLGDWFSLVDKQWIKLDIQEQRENEDVKIAAMSKYAKKREKRANKQDSATHFIALQSLLMGLWDSFFWRDRKMSETF